MEWLDVFVMVKKKKVNAWMGLERLVEFDWGGGAGSLLV